MQQIRDAGVRPSVVLNPHTPAVMIEEILPFVDMVLVMTVNPGFGGQRFIAQTLSKIRTIREMITQRGLAVDVEVDGGIDENTAARVVEHGGSGSGHRRVQPPGWCARRYVRLAGSGVLMAARNKSQRCGWLFVIGRR